MSNTTVSTGIAHIANVLDSSDYSDKEVFILIPSIRLTDDSAAKKYTEDFDKICTWSAESEPGTQKFCAFQPRNRQDGENQIWALEHFDSESSLAEHRASAPVKEMLSWLLTTKPNGHHPLPLPVPLQIMKGSFVRPAVKEVQDPFVVITQLEFQPEMVSDIDAAILEFNVDAQNGEDTLMFVPGKTEKGIWIVAAYRTKQDFEKGFSRERLENVNIRGLIEIWKEEFLELTAGYLFR